MLKRVVLSVMLMVLALLPAGSLNAEEAEGEKMESGLLEFLKKVTVGMYFDVGYEYNFRNPRSDINNFRSLDPKHNQFEIHMAQLSFEKVPTMEGGVGDYIGFRTDLAFGKDAERIHAAGLGEEDQPFDLTQAYIHVLAPVGNGLNIYAGKYVTLAGFEVIEAKDNPNITRSFLFGLAIPFTHTGVRMSYGVGPATLTIGVNNGWDNVDDNNDGKTIESQLAFESENASLYVTGYFGPEQDGVDGDWRELITIVGSYSPIESLTLSVDLDLGWEQSVNFDVMEKDVFWWGVAGYVVYEINPMLSVALRGEYFQDDDGARTGFEQKMWEITPTLSIKPFVGHRTFDNLEFRVEYRHDQSDERVFEDSNGSLKKSQDTVALQLLYYFTI
jgi:hypothetical protein